MGQGLGPSKINFFRMKHPDKDVTSEQLKHNRIRKAFYEKGLPDPDRIDDKPNFDPEFAFHDVLYPSNVRPEDNDLALAIAAHRQYENPLTRHFGKSRGTRGNQVEGTGIGPSNASKKR